MDIITNTASLDGLLVSLRQAGFEAQRSIGGDNQISISLDLLSFADDAGIGLNFDAWSIPGLPVDLPIGLSGDYKIPLSGGMTLGLDIGLDDDGNFFVDTPTLDASLKLGHGPFEFSEVGLANDTEDGTLRSYIDIDGNVSTDFTAGQDWISAVGLVTDVSAAAVYRTVYDAAAGTTRIWLEGVLTSQLDISETNVNLNSVQNISADNDLRSIINNNEGALLTIAGHLLPADLKTPQVSGVGSVVIGTVSYDVQQLRYSSVHNTTTLVLSTHVEGAAAAETAQLRKAFGSTNTNEEGVEIKKAPFALHLGMFALEVGKDGFIEFSVAVNASIDGRLNSQSITDLTSANISVGFSETPEYALFVPITLSGVMDGLVDGRAYISAFSNNLPEDISFTQLVYAIPQSLSFEGLADLLAMKTVSLDMILAGLETLFDDMVGINKDVWVDGSQNIYEQRYTAVNIGENDRLTQWTLPVATLLDETVSVTSNYSHYRQDGFAQSFFADDNGSSRNITTWENTDSGQRYLGYEDTDTDTLHLYELMTEVAASAYLKTAAFRTSYKLDSTSKASRSVLNVNGQSRILQRYIIDDGIDDGAATVWGYEALSSDGQTQLYAMQEHWVKTGAYSDGNATFTAASGDDILKQGVGVKADLNLTKGVLKSGSLYQKVDIIDTSVADLLGDDATDFVATLGNVISQTHAFLDDDSSLSDLAESINSKLRTAFGLAAGFSPLAFTYADSTLAIDFDLEFKDTDTLNLEFGIADLGLGDAFNGLPLEASAKAAITLDAYAQLTAGLGFDLSDITDPLLFIDADTSFSAGVSGEANDIKMTLGLDTGLPMGSVGLLIDDGHIGVGAEFMLSFTEPGETIDADIVYDGRIGLADLSRSLEVDGKAAIDVNLPMYFPIKALPVGGSVDDSNLDGWADNVLHFDTGASVSLEDGFSFNGINYVMPEFNMDFGGVAALYAMLNDPGNILSGLTTFFNGLDLVAEGIGSIDLPLIGGASFDELATKLKGLRELVMAAKVPVAAILADEYNFNDNSPTLKQLLDALKDDVDAGGVFDIIVEAIRNALYSGLEGINSDLFYFATPDLDAYGNLQYDVAGKILHKKPTSADDIQLTLSPEGALSFNIMFGGVLLGNKNTDSNTIGPAAIDLNFSEGIPGLSLDVQAQIMVTLDYLMGIGLGIDGDGIYLDTSGINSAGEEIGMDLEATFTTAGNSATNKGSFSHDNDSTEGHSAVSGTLGFLTMDLFGEAGLNGHLGLDIQGSGGKWRSGDLALAMNANAQAYADIKATASTLAGGILPSMAAFIEYDQVIGDATWSSNTGFDTSFGDPEVTLYDVTLDAGSIMDSFLGESLSTIKAIIEPMRPVIDLLTLEIDLGITKVQLIDMAYLKLPAKTVDTAKKVIQVMNSTLEFIDAMDTVDGVINFGDFHLTESFLKDPDEPATQIELGASRAAPTGGSESSRKAAAGPDQKGLDAGGASSFRLPILDDPSTALGLLTGKTVDLFWYDLPDLDLEFTYEKSYPIFPGLNAGIKGSVGASTNFDFGFDTSGFVEFQQSGYATSEIWRIMNGFYLDDHGLENTASDLDEIVLTALFGASASLGIGGLVEAGVMGGIEARIGFDLNDKLSQFDNGNPTGDGKLYGAELGARISHGPQCLFDVHGQMTVFLEAFLWVGINLGFSKVTLYEAAERFVDETIIEFSWECVHEAPERIAQLAGNELKLKYYGDDAAGQHAYIVEQLDIADHPAGWTIETLFNKGFLDFDFYTSKELNDLSARLKAYSSGDLLVVSTGQRVEVYKASDINLISTLGTDGDDHYRISNINNHNVDMVLSTGGGSDLVEVNLGGKVTANSARNITINTDKDNDIGNDIVTINGDADSVVSNITIDAGRGDDRVKVASAITTDTIIMQGGLGNDSLRLDGEQSGYQLFAAFGGAGSDTIMGGGGATLSTATEPLICLTRVRLLLLPSSHYLISVRLITVMNCTLVYWPKF